MEQDKTIRDREEDEIEIDLLALASDFFKIFRAHLKKIVLVVLLILFGYCGYMYLSYSPLYQSQATFTVETGDSTGSSYSFYYSSDTADQLSKTFPYILESNYFNSVLLQNLGEKTLNGSLSAETVSDSNMVTMTATSPDAQEALKILNTALEIYPQTARFVLGDTQFHIINEPVLATVPYNRPSVIKTVGIGLFAGAFVAGLIVAVIAFFKKSARTLEQMSKITNLKCLAVLPSVSFKARQKKTPRTISLLDRRVSFDYKENIHSMQIRLERMMEKNNGKIIMVTSTAASEGKSTVSMNLGLSLSMAGKRVLLLDMDLRKPSLAKMLHSSNSKDLKEILSGDPTVFESMTPVYGDNLFFAGNEKGIKNPVKLFSSSNLSKRFEHLKSYFDYIIIDTAPCGIFQDAYELQHVSDLILYVVKYDFVPLQKIQESLSGFEQDNNRSIVYVFNEYMNSLNDYGYGKYRYRYYGNYNGVKS